MARAEGVPPLLLQIELVAFFETGIHFGSHDTHGTLSALNTFIESEKPNQSSDQIPYSKVGRLVGFSPARIQEWLQKGGTR
jgi:hypothetical protein